jgi:subtilisin family serine protease
MKKKLYFFIVLIALMINFRIANAQQPTPTPPEYIPNDPKADLTQSRNINLLKAYAKIMDIEHNGQPAMQQAVMVFLDEWVDCTHPDLQANCMASLAFNATDRPYQNSERHGSQAAGTGAAVTDNKAGVSSPTFMNRLKFIPIKVCDGNLCKPEWVQAGLQKVLDYKRQGIPIVVAGCNFLSGVSDAAGMDTLLKALDTEQVDLVAPADDSLVNMDNNNSFPVSYARRYTNIIGVTAADATGQKLTAAYGPNTISLVAPGVNVQTVSFLDPVNSSSSMSGTSAVTEQIAAVYALVRIYREPNSAKAREILKYTAHMFPDFEEKLMAAPGSKDDAGRMAGLIDAYDALTMQFGCPATSSLPTWVTQRGTNKAVALISVSAIRGPFPVKAEQSSLNPDGQTRITMFAYSVGQDKGAINITARDSMSQTVVLPVEFVGALSASLSCVSQLNINLTSQPQLAAGDVALTITVAGQKSAEAVITIK